jgi:hypothetical protein
MRAVRLAVACVAAITALAATGCSSSPPKPAQPVPTLGRVAGIFSHGSKGFGTVKPGTVFNGGDPSGLVEHITWTTWGGPRASGSGKADWVGTGQDVAEGKFEAVTIVAFDLGTCHGKRMYQAVEWYFPQHGQAFNAHHYENICAGSYVPELVTAG